MGVAVEVALNDWDWDCAASLPTSAATALVDGTKTSVTFWAPRGVSARVLSEAVEDGWMLLPVAFAEPVMVEVLPSTAAAANEDDAEVVDDQDADGAVSSAAAALVILCVPSSCPANHVGRMTPEGLSYANVWLACVSEAAPVSWWKHFSIVIGPARGGFGSYVAQ